MRSRLQLLSSHSPEGPSTQVYVSINRSSFLVRVLIARALLLGALGPVLGKRESSFDWYLEL